jgi:arylsulfatase A-like enzyme
MKPTLLLALCAIASPAFSAQKPNVILIMADDLGYGDIGCYGSKQNPTPNLDALAKQGMRFTDYHSNGAVCSPTRAALMTGRYQQRAGIGGVVTAKSHRDKGMAVEETTIADLLSANGYATAIFGKWHLGYDPRFNPVRQGFGEFIGFVSGNVDYFSHIDQEQHEDWWHGDRLKPEEGYVTRLITRHGLRFIEENKDKPFFLYLPHLTPHSPYQGPDDRAIRGAAGQKPGKGDGRNLRQTYAGMIAEMDKGIGEITAALDKHGLTGRTLVVFCSDNGANRNGSNGPLRDGKGSIHEGGHRVPMIARWPGAIPAGKVSDATVLGMDFFPTLLDLAGIKPPGNLDGISIVPVLRAEGALPERTVFWSVGQGSAARRGPWKLVIGNQAGKDEGKLYHLGNDPAEKTPVHEPGIQDPLRKDLDAWLESWASVPQHS